MTGIYLLDTNAAIARMSEDKDIIKFLEEADDVFIPSIVLGELYFGAHKSGRVEANLMEVEVLALSGAAIGCDIETARVYGRIRYELRAKGRPIPVNDTWIAAIALQHNLTLLTRDGHFKEVDNLPLQSW